MRVYQGDSTDGQPSPHTFVEVSPDSFIEVEFPQMDSLDEGTKQRLRAFLRKIRTQEKRHIYHIRMAKRYFTTLIPIPNLKLVGEF